MSDDHLSLDELAELDEGLLTPQRSSAVREHLDGCGQCRAKAERIATTRSLLGDLPPVPMPAEVRARLDRVIAEEAATSTGNAATAAATASNVVAMPRRRFGRPTMAASAAAAAFVLVISAIVVAHLHGSPGSSEDAGAASAGNIVGTIPSSVGIFPVSKTGRTYTPTSLPGAVSKLLAVNTPAAPVTGAVASPAASATPAPSPAPGLGAHTTRSPGHSGKDEATYGAEQQVPRSLAALYDSQPRLLACAQTVTPTVGLLPLAVDFARWSGPPFHRAPSMIFVFAGTTNGTVRVVVVAPACDGSSIRQFTQVTLPN